MPAGRPSLYTQEIAETICDRIANGESLTAICEDEGMPHRTTAMRWLDNYAEFATNHARARRWQADAMDDLILKTAKDSTAETAPADRVKIGAYQWRAARLEPKKYGDTKQVQLRGRIGVFDPSGMSDERLAALESTLGDFAASGRDAPDGAGGEGAEGGDPEA